ncbi:hypothetical protein GCM10009716_38740 [Streptomyces sodiiphilus]|uniref:Uncharacterized protein n=1 Tax=Streptomyces sodiiphilus TaxID=226217 RepID=A0ABN2PNE9_9ACTN
MALSALPRSIPMRSRPGEREEREAGASGFVRARCDGPDIRDGDAVLSMISAITGVITIAFLGAGCDALLITRRCAL